MNFTAIKTFIILAEQRGGLQLKKYSNCIERACHGIKGAVVIGLVMGVVSSGSSYAAEATVEATPYGGNDVGAGLVPPPGLYAATGFLYFTGRSYLPDTWGKATNTHISLNSAIPFGAIEYSYPFQIFGGQVASLLQVPVEHGRIHVQQSGGAGYDQHDDSIGDIYMDAFYWSKNLGAPGYRMTDENIALTPWPMFPLGLNIATGIALKAPTGHYNSAKYYNNGSNIWVFSPNIGMTYLSPPDPLGGPFEVSARAYYSFPLKNSETQWQSGQVLDIDFAVGQYITPLLELAIAGSWEKQTTSDSHESIMAPNGVRYPEDLPAGNRFGQVLLGPVMNINLPNNYGSIKLKYQTGVYERNHFNGQEFVLSYGLKFF